MLFSGLDNRKEEALKNFTKAIELYDKLIAGVSENWYPYEEMYPALLAKYYLKARMVFNDMYEYFWVSNSTNGISDL